MTIYFELEENPKGTAQMKGTSFQGGRIHHYEKPIVRRQADIYRQAILEALTDTQQEVPRYEEPISVTVNFCYSIKDRKRWGEWKTSKPDLDNSVKLLLDVMTKMGFWKDDALISRLVITKKLSGAPSVEIDIRRLIQ